MGLRALVVAAAVAVCTPCWTAMAAPPILGTGEIGDSKLRITGRYQFRYNAAASGGFGEADFTHGFTFERLRLLASGDLGERVSYRLQFGADRGVSFRALDAVVGIELTEDVGVKLGQHVVAYSRELDTSSTRLLAVDRSPTDRVFGLGRSEMVELAWQRDRARLRFTASDGRGATGGGYASSREADLAVTARLELLPFGSWGQFRDQSAFRGQDDGLLIGLAAHAQTGGETGGTADVDVFQATADIGYESDGFGVMLVGHARQTEVDGGERFSDFGLLAQGGVFVHEQVELFARYDVVLPDSDRPDDEDEMFQSIAVGMNYFFVPESHVIKLVIDASWYPDRESESIVDAATRTGILSSDESQFALRVQVQVLF